MPALPWCRKPASPLPAAGSGHRLFLIDRKVLEPVGTEGGAAEEFAVLGATGNGEGAWPLAVCTNA